MKTFPAGQKDIPNNGGFFPMFLMYITEPYTKAIPRGKKDIPSYGFFFPYIPHEHIVYKSEN